MSGTNSEIVGSEFIYTYLSSNIRNSCIISSNASLESRLNIGPCTLILVFFLTPSYISIAIFIQFLLCQIKWEWADLFNSGYCDFLFKTCISSGFNQIIVNFASAKNNFFYSSWIVSSRSTVFDYSLEYSSCKKIMKF